MRGYISMSIWMVSIRIAMCHYDTQQKVLGQDLRFILPKIIGSTMAMILAKINSKILCKIMVAHFLYFK